MDRLVRILRIRPAMVFVLLMVSVVRTLILVAPLSVMGASAGASLVAMMPTLVRIIAAALEAPAMAFSLLTRPMHRPLILLEFPARWSTVAGFVLPVTDMFSIQS